MAAHFNLTLDTTAPAGVTITLAGGASATGTRDVTATIATSDGDTTGYQMKVYGDVDTGYDADVQATEGASTWISFSGSKAIRLSTGDGSKTVRVKIRDDVWNASSESTDAITLDTSAPTVTITSAATRSRISKVTGRDETEFGWEADQDFTEYKVKVVANSGAAHNTGDLIGTSSGSENTSGSGSFPATTEIITTITGADLEAASAGDGSKVIKVFAKNATGNWSV